MARFGLAGLLAASIMAAAPHAMARGGGEGVTNSGSCSVQSTWTLTAKPDNGQLEVEFQVDENVSGHVWKVLLSDNGAIFFKGKVMTQAPSGSFDIRKFTADQAGTDNILAQARNVNTGETCQGSVSI